MDNFDRILIVAYLSLNTVMLIAIGTTMVDWASEDYSQAYEQGAKDMAKYMNQQKATQND